MDEQELLPCPFCGYDWPLLITHSSDAGNEYSVRCYNGCCERGDEYRDEAIKLWNTRKHSTKGWQDDDAVERLAYSVANSKLGEGPEVRCEGPTPYEIGIARQWVRRVLDALKQS